MNNRRGIPPLPNWSNRFSSIIIEDNLLYLSNNYIVNIDLYNKQFIQLIHSSLNVYFENKFSVICKIKDISNKVNEASHMFIAVDSSGNVCFFNKIKEKNQNPERSNYKERTIEEIRASNESVCFREERYISKIGRSVIKTILNVNLKNYYKNTNNKCKYEEHLFQDLNIVLLGDINGNIDILEYFYNEKEKKIQMDKNKFTSIQISKGICTDMIFIPQKNIFIFSTTYGTIEFYSILEKNKNESEILYKNQNTLLILTHLYESNLSFIFSLDYFLSNNFEQINLSIIDKNGSFALKSLYFKDILLVKDYFSNLKILPYENSENNDLKENLIDYNFCFRILEKNKFNNKGIQDQYLFFAHKIILKYTNEKYFEIFFTSNKGKIYYTSIFFQDYLISTQNNIGLKLKYQEVPENPHNKDIFSIIHYNENKLIFISADGVISLFNHNSKFFEMDFITVRFRPSAFVENLNKGKTLFFYDEGNNLLKYNYDKLKNGLQALGRNPVKIKNSDKKYVFFEKNLNINKKEIKDCLKIKNCIQASFNENIFALLEYNYILKSYSLSVYDFESDTRIYRRDLLFKIKSMQFAFERKFKDIQELIENRDDLKKSETKQISKIDEFLNEINLKNYSESNHVDIKMDYKIDYDYQLELDFSEEKGDNLEREFFLNDNSHVKIYNNCSINDFNLGLNESDNYQQNNQFKEFNIKEKNKTKGKKKKRTYFK